MAAAEERRVGYSVYGDTFDLESTDWLQSIPPYTHLTEILSTRAYQLLEIYALWLTTCTDCLRLLYHPPHPRALHCSTKKPTRHLSGAQCPHQYTYIWSHMAVVYQTWSRGQLGCRRSRVFLHHPFFFIATPRRALIKVANIVG